MNDHEELWYVIAADTLRSALNDAKAGKSVGDIMRELTNATDEGNGIRIERSEMN